jgi:hypothetical protein
MALKIAPWRVRLEVYTARQGCISPPIRPQRLGEEYVAMAMREHDPGVMMAQSSLMGCTLTETMQMLEPIGIDRWPMELSYKFGTRDARVPLGGVGSCPTGNLIP